ncbi:CDP-glycerol glycerophosphotransferase family protein [Ectobacillus sp. SYSU M60031]|uniref:CDP-glycerol glycerophosphotransferase family protein n=2 Tax=Ectobacillus ponti TaxID=2961894 RepID=A0AA41XAE9_9BACI|nr:CDP-glycerol glycerophosphotransferase family protein [Ectobacillus ponti]
MYIYDELRRQDESCQVIFLYKRTCKYRLPQDYRTRAYEFESLHLLHTLKSIYHLATSRHVVIDNYFGFLAAVKFREGVQCTQLWHAGGAIKQFGLLAPSARSRSKRAQRRFQKVYNNFHRVVVSSEAMARVYSSAFSLPMERMLPLGMPRTDLFFQPDKQARIIRQLYDDNPGLRHKKVLLYAPTFREQELDSFSLQLDVDLLYKHLREEYALIVKLHPAILQATDLPEKYPGFVYDYSGYPHINDLLLVTDILITDYSSVPFEFCLLKRPMIFFAYDLGPYTEKGGMMADYASQVPGPIAFTTEELLQHIQQQTFQQEQIEQFSLMWNQYTAGEASKLFVEQVLKQMPAGHSTAWGQRMQMLRKQRERAE